MLTHSKDARSENMISAPPTTCGEDAVLELNIMENVPTQLPTIKVKLSLFTPRRYMRGVEVYLRSFLTSVLDGGTDTD
jgi:hypothetical protein